MIRILLLSALALVGVAALPAVEPAPPPRLKKPTLYFPTTVGAKWVYQLDDEEWTEVVTGVKEKDGVYIVTYATLTVKGKPGRERQVAVSERGLASVEGGEPKFAPPWLMLMLPHKEGESWFYKEGALRVKHTQGKPQLVKVPAGEFEAIPVESIAWVDREEAIQQTRWYAPGIGLVKDGPGRGIKLKSFTPGKE